MRRPVAFHPLLIAAFPVLFLWSQNRTEVTAHHALPVLGIAVAATAAVAALATLLLRDHRRGALAASGIAMLFFSFGHVEGLLGVPRDVLLSLWAGLAVTVTVVAVRLRGRLQPTTRTLNAAGAILLITSLLPVATEAVAEDAPAHVAATGSTIRAGRVEEPRRDIWYVILDRYARGDSMQRRFGYDNRDFLSLLEDRGFDVADRSVANYPKTAHSLASSLNMRYLDHLTGRTRGDDWGAVYAMLQRHALGRFLTAHGYRYLHLGNWWEPTQDSPYAHASYRYDSRSEFAQVLEDTTAWPAVRDLFTDQAPVGWHNRMRESTAYLFDKLDELAARDFPGPTFVFAHLTIPHEPYVFDADGSHLSEAEADLRTEAENYVGQVRYANRRLQGFVDRLLANHQPEPIVVIQADEGPHPERYTRYPRHFNWPRAADDELAEKLHILNAYHLPGVDDAQIGEDITPVNTFRLILDHYFGADLGMLPERVYVFENHRDLYDFTDVTERVR